jgi:hypothetical protein
MSNLTTTMIVNSANAVNEQYFLIKARRKYKEENSEQAEKDRKEARKNCSPVNPNNLNKLFDYINSQKNPLDSMNNDKIKGVLPYLEEKFAKDLECAKKGGKMECIKDDQGYVASVKCSV